MRKIIVLLMLFLSFIILQSITAESMEDEKNDFYFSIIPTGFLKVEAEAGYTGFRIIDGTETFLLTALEGGYEGFTYYKDESTIPIIPVIGENELGKTELTRIPIAWKVGVKQGFLWNDRLEQNLVEGYMFYRGRFEIYSAGDEVPYLFETGLPDAVQLFQTSFITGVSYNDVFVSSHQVWDGIYADLNFEYAPGLINSIADYGRIHGELSAFLPIVDLETDNKLNVFSLYIGNRVSASWEFGEYRTVAGRLQNEFDIRGVEIERFDSGFIIFDNFDIRINMPALFNEGIVPTATIFADAGYHWESADYNGFLLSAGAGLGLNIFSFALVGIRMDYSFNNSKLDGKKLSLEFNYRFQF